MATQTNNNDIFLAYDTLADEQDHEDDDNDEYMEDEPPTQSLAQSAEFGDDLPSRRSSFLCYLGVSGIVALAFLLGLLSSSFFSLFSSEKWTLSTRNPLILVSIDGFRYDYLRLWKEHAPCLASLAETGVNTEYMIPVFPSKTFPNHWSIVTGLYPESHGIVSNSFFSPALNDSFSIGGPTSNNPAWWKGVPIWSVLEDNGIKSGVCFWPGSEAVTTAHRWKSYNGSMPYAERLQVVKDWIMGPDPPQFVAMYLEGVDHAGHQHGPNTDSVVTAIERVDATICELASFLGQALGYAPNGANIVIVSDHGMTRVDARRTIRWEDLVNAAPEHDINGMIAHVSEYSPVVQVWPREGFTEELKVALDKAGQALRGAPGGDRLISFYLKEDLLPRFHYSQSERIAPIVGLVAHPWMLLAPDSSLNINGNHGWDPLIPDMWSFFLANGPDFTSKAALYPFENVNLMNLFAALLGVTPPPNNGSDILVDQLLRA